MVLAVVTEASLFLNLLFSYFYVAVQSSGWPPEGPPELKLALPNTILLLASSLTMWWGERGIRRGSRAQLLLGALATFVLGTAFIAIQAIEYENHRFTPQTDVYGSLFFTITGFHGAHVIVGLLMVAFVVARALAGSLTSARHLAVQNVAFYWHFVDVVWLCVFASLYLSPRLW
jgi:heme/copper-type cytochrome/quinol oxidase subunit 3